MKREDTIGFRVRTLSLGIKRAVDISKSRGNDSSPSVTHGWVIGYLYDNMDSEIYQRDIEKKFSVRRPTMTAILQLMEKNGLITREKSEADARLKRISLTPLALEIHLNHEKGIERFENYIRRGISDEDMEAFCRVTERLHENIAMAEKEFRFNSEEEK